MSGKGNFYDNSTDESFFKSLPAELVWPRNWQTRRHVEIALFEFYNPRRKRSAIGWKSLVAFELRAASHKHMAGTQLVQVHIQEAQDIATNWL